MSSGGSIRAGYDHIGLRHEVEAKFARFQVQRRCHLLALALVLRGSSDVQIACKVVSLLALYRLKSSLCISL